MSCSRTQRSDAGEARTRGPSVSSQALYHRATALHKLRGYTEGSRMSSFYKVCTIRPFSVTADLRIICFFSVLLIVKYNIGLKTLLQQGISEPFFYYLLFYF